MALSNDTKKRVVIALTSEAAGAEVAALDSDLSTAQSNISTLQTDLTAAKAGTTLTYGAVGTIAPVAKAAAAGVATTPARSDHVHALGNRGILNEEVTNAAAKSAADAVHAALAGTAAANLFPGPITQPDVPRSLLFTFVAGWDGGDITVVGTDINDAAITEVVAANPGGTTETARCFKSIVSMTKGAVGANGATVSVGTENRLGVKVALTSTFGLCFLADTAAWEKAASVNAYGFKPTTAPNGAHDYWFLGNM